MISPNPAQETLQDIGEQGLLQRLNRFCCGVGDDGAILEVRGKLVVTTDVLVEGVHFSLGLTHPTVTTPPHAAGWRSAAANLSDLAAMGAFPLGITIGLSLPPHIPVQWIEDLYQGITDCLAPWQVNIVGGDLVRSQQVSLAITALGEVAPDTIIQRSTAKPGDRIVMTGIHGRSRVGLELLLGRDLKVDHPETWIAAHQYPRPRLDLLPYLSNSDLSNPAFSPPAGMDSSDGLADAVLQICRSSQVGAILDQQAILASPEIQHLIQVVGLEQALEWVLYGGEDFELILCLSMEQATEFCLKTNSIAIGQVIEKTSQASLDVMLQDDQGMVRSLSLAKGFQHFK